MADTDRKNKSGIVPPRRVYMVQFLYIWPDGISRWNTCDAHFSKRKDAEQCALHRLKDDSISKTRIIRYDHPIVVKRYEARNG